MAKTQLQKLTAHIRTVQSWTGEQSVYSLLDTFISLNLLDRDANPAKWQELRTALADNKELKDVDVRDFLTDKAESRNGNWWWNPKNWA